MPPSMNTNSGSSTSDSPARGGTAAGLRLARAAFGLGVLCAATALLAGPAYRLQWVSLGIGLQTVRWAAIVALVAAALALIAWLMPGPAIGRRGWAATALVLSLAVAAPPWYLYWKLQQLPRIHDISTDTAMPPTFDAVLPLRQGARNSVDYSASTAAEQRRGYPDIAPLTLTLAPDAALGRALDAARSMGWQIVAVAPPQLRIEATDTTLLFGFKDDVVIRITPQGTGSRIDVRSLSRVGGSDFGANAKRVRAYLKDLAARAAAPA
jgi:uncharacterized protein (DUF1499 family)